MNKTEYYRKRIALIIKSISDRFSSYLNEMNPSKRKCALIVAFVVCLTVLVIQTMVAYFKLIDKI